MTRAWVTVPACPSPVREFHLVWWMARESDVSDISYILRWHCLQTQINYPEVSPLVWLMVLLYLYK